MSEEDPSRWADGGGPPGALELVRAIERTPRAPAMLRPATPRHVGARRMFSGTRLIGGAVATLAVVGGLALWFWPRPPRPVVVREPTAIDATPTPHVIAPIGRSAPAGITGPERTAPVAIPISVGDTPSPVPPNRTAPSVVGQHEVAAVRPQQVDDRLGSDPDGYLTVHTSPTSRVFIDAHDTGRDTPVSRLRVHAGQHIIGLRTSDGVMTKVTVEIQAHQTMTLTRQLPIPTPAVESPVGAELSVAQLRTVVQRNRSGLQHCYEAAARETHSSEPMRANIDFAAGSDGVVTRANVTLGPGAPAQLATCIAEQVRGWRLPAGGEAAFPIVFSPGGDTAAPPEPVTPPDAGRLERARELMLAGDERGVIALLRGARSQQELELLIATYQNVGDTSAKLAAMQRYIDRYPTTPRARQYQQVLLRGRPTP